jgi:hypothetical protein
MIKNKIYALMDKTIKNICEARKTNKKEGPRSAERDVERNIERDGRKEID